MGCVAKDTIFCLGRVESDFLEYVALALRPFHRKFRSRRGREGEFWGVQRPLHRHFCVLSSLLSSLGWLVRGNKTVFLMDRVFVPSGR